MTRGRRYSRRVFSALIIDADESATGTIEGALQPLGFEFTRTHEAPEAMQIARSATPDIIFLRVELPSVSGFSVCNKLRRSDETRYIPLVMYASDVTDDVFEQHRNLKTHADEYLKLPFESGALIGAVGSLIEITPGEAADEFAENETEDILDVEIDDVMLEEGGTEEPGLSMAEFDDDFADIEGSEPKDVAQNLELSEETDAAFDALTIEESLTNGRVPMEDLGAPTPEAARDHLDVPESAGVAFEDADIEIEDAIEPDLELDIGYSDEPANGTDRLNEDPPIPPPPESASSDHHLEIPLSASADYSEHGVSAPAADSDNDDVLTGIPANEPQSYRDLPLQSEVETIPGVEIPEEAGNEFQAQREVLRLKGQLNAKNREILTLKEDLETQQRAVLDAHRKTRELQFQLGELEEKLLHSQEEAIGAREQAEAAQRDKATALKREEGFKNRLEIGQKRIDELEATLQTTKVKLSADSEELTAEIARLQREITVTRESEQSISVQFENLRRENIELSERLETATHNNSTLSDTIAQLEQDFARAQHAAQEALEDGQAARARVEQEKQDALRSLAQEHQAELEFEETQHQSESERLRGQITEIESESQRLRAQLQQAQEHSQTRESQLNERITALEADVSQLSDTLSSVESELRERRDAGERAQQALAVALRVLDGRTSP